MIVVVIPARYASTRYPGKPLVELHGATGRARTLVRRSWDAAISVAGVDRVIVATDDARIAEHAVGFGAEVAMTSDRHRNGTERVAEVVAGLDGVEIAVNLQGDAPLTPPWFVESLVAALRARPDMDMATPVLPLDAEALVSFRADRAAGRVGGTTAVFGADRAALYFSKEVIPYGAGPGEAFHHVGVYAYRPSLLSAYAAAPPGPLETLEGLEQLRVLESGGRLLCVEVDSRGRAFWELNNPADVPRIEAMMATMGIE